MANAPELNIIVQDIIKHVETKLQSTPYLPFSIAAFSTLKMKIVEYIAELINESIKVSKRHQCDTISSTHVERASEYLVSNSSRRFYKHLGTIGGIFLGAALSNILAMTVAGQYSAVSTIVSAGLGIIGAFMIALHIAND